MKTTPIFLTRIVATLGLSVVLLMPIAICGCAKFLSPAYNSEQVKSKLIQLSSVPDRNKVVNLSSLTDQQREQLNAIYDELWPKVADLIKEREELHHEVNQGNISQAECTAQWTKMTIAIKSAAADMVGKILDKLTPDQVVELWNQIHPGEAP